jgi:hypothetical protein
MPADESPISGQSPGKWPEIDPHRQARLGILFDSAKNSAVMRAFDDGRRGNPYFEVSCFRRYADPATVSIGRAVVRTGTVADRLSRYNRQPSAPAAMASPTPSDAMTSTSVSNNSTPHS